MKKGFGIVPLLLCAALAFGTTCMTAWRRTSRWIGECWMFLSCPVTTDYSAISRLIHPAPGSAPQATSRAVRPARDQRPWIERFTLQRNTFAY